MDGTPFLIAGYAVTWSALAWYAWRLERRAGRAGRALDSLARGRETDAPEASP